MSERRDDGAAQPRLPGRRANSSPAAETRADRTQQRERPTALGRGAPNGRSLGVHDVTSYCLRGTMANGRQVHAGAIATLDRAIPFGTRLLIDGRTYTVEDRIGSGSSFDVWLPSCSLSLQWGRRRLEVVVLP